MSDNTEFKTMGQLYDHVRRAIAHLVVFEGDEIVGTGTGFVCGSDGALLTAAHVVAGGFPVRNGELKDRLVVACLVYQERQLLYRIAVCPIEVIGVGLLKPVQFDIALLLPAEKQATPLSYLSVSLTPPQLGDELYFGGYSDEVEFPFLIDRELPPNTEGLSIFRKAFDSGIKARIAGPIIKRGTVGSAVEGGAMMEEKVLVKQTYFYLDNQAHNGASGGPIVDRNGVARGLISKRALTKIEDARDLKDPTLKVPSGATLGVALDPLAVVFGVQNETT